MSQQQSLSQQPTDMPAWDWAQAPDADLKVHTSDSEGTKQAKEAEKEQEEHERLECEECTEQERQEVIEVAWQAAAVEAEAVQQSVAKDKGQAGELQALGQALSVGGVQFNDWGLDQDDGGTPCKCQAMAGGQSCSPCRKRKKKCSWAMMEDSEGVTGGSRKWAGTGGSQGSRRKKGWTSDEDDDNNNKIEEVPALVVPQFEVAHLHLIGEALELGGSGQGVPERLYDKQMLVVQGRQAVAMEQMAVAMELQALAMQAYVRHMTAPLPWPSVGRVGVVAGRVETGTGGSQLGVKQSESEVAEEPEESGSEGIKDVEGEEDMQE
ncbi:hypothetical protein F5141DRAFT_1213136 [Pisolithus sp. B1]|nr:hypothetical protein F5141DRAFT_1213136 [Pisolithus sp. B1]